MKITKQQLIKIQSTLRRGVVVNTVHYSTGDTKKFSFDGFSNVECPHKYCEMHPKNPGRKSGDMCQGFMRWVDQTSEEHNEVESCPYVGAAEITIADGNLVKNIEQTMRNAVTQELETKLIKPSEYE